MSTQVAVIPQGIAVPAHLMTPEAAAEIAAANAAAAGGIKSGGFPRISIKGGKFHEVDGGDIKTYLSPALPGQPALPLMLLEAVIIAANPALSKTFYEGEYKDGDDREPSCSADNGIVPDAHIINKQSPVCATCPQNQWGSKISKASGKEIKACSDNKRLAILPSMDLTYKALGLSVTPASLQHWGEYVKALTGRNVAVHSVVTNITFDHTAAFPKLQFAFNRFLTEAEYATVRERASGDDVKNIVAPVRTVLALPAPAQAGALPAPAPAPTAPVPPVPAPTPQQEPGPAPVPLQAGFGAAQPAAAPAAPAEAPKRTRRTREQIEADKLAASGGAPAPGPVSAADLSHLPPAIRAAVEAVGPSSPAGQALLAQFPAPGFITEPAATPAAPAEADKAQPSGVVPPAPAAAPVGFGASAVAVLPGQAAPAPAVSAAALSLKAALEKKLGINQPPAA